MERVAARQPYIYRKGLVMEEKGKKPVKERQLQKCWNIKGTIHRSEKELREDLARQGRKLITPGR